MCKCMIRQAVSIRGRAAFVAECETRITGGTSVKILLQQWRSACRLSVGLMSGALLMTGDTALAHHSFSMFEYGTSTELEGTVQELKFVNPHAFIMLKVKGKDGRVETWTLEGQPTAMLE